MPSKLRLAGTAIRAMFERDPEFEFELQRCVVAEIVRGMMPKDLDEVHRKLIASEVAKAQHAIMATGVEGKTYDEIVRKKVADAVAAVRAAYYTETLPAGRQKELQDAVTSAIDSELRRTVEAKVAAINEDIEAKLAKRMSSIDLDARVQAIVDLRVEAEIERRVAERLAAIAAAAADASKMTR